MRTQAHRLLRARLQMVSSAQLPSPVLRTRMRSPDMGRSRPSSMRS